MSKIRTHTDSRLKFAPFGHESNGTNLRGEDGFLIVILILLLITSSSPQITQ